MFEALEITKDGMTVRKDYVAIPRLDYEDLIRTDFKYHQAMEELRDLFDNAKLNWNKTKLVFDEDEVSHAIKHIVGTMYKTTLTRLQAEKEHKDE
jgi:hypothetical protein